MTIPTDHQGFGVSPEAFHSRSVRAHSTSPSRATFSRRAFTRSVALAALAIGVSAGSAHASDPPPWEGIRHMLDLNVASWGLSGQTPARMEAANLNGHAGAEVVVRFTPSNSLVVFASAGMETCPHRLALSGVTDFALLPSGIVFSTASGLSLATWNSVTNTFTVMPVTGSSAFAGATNLSTSSAGAIQHVAGIRSNGTSIAWSTILANVIGTSYTITAPASMNAARLLHWNPANPTEVDLAIRTNTTITVRNSSNTVLPGASYPSYGAAQVFSVQRGASFDRLHFTVPVGTAQFLGTLDPVLGALTPMDASGYAIATLAFGDYDGTGTSDGIASLVSGASAFILHGNPWNQMNAFTLGTPMTADYAAQAASPVCALADFEGDGDLDIIGLSSSLTLEIPANPRLKEDDYLFQVDMPAASCSLVNHVATFQMTTLKMDPPLGVAAAATHVSIEFYVQDSLTGTVSATPWATRLVPIPTTVSYDENLEPYIALPAQVFTGSLGAHPDTSAFHIRMQSVYSTNGTTITTRVAPALTGYYSFDPIVMSDLAEAAAASFIRDIDDVDPPRLGDGNRESNISPYPPRP